MDTQVQPIYDDLTTTPRYLGEVLDAGHYTFSDACDLVSTYDDCAEPFLDPEEAHVVINTVTTAFLQSVLGHDQAADWLPPDGAPLEWTGVE